MNKAELQDLEIPTRVAFVNVSTGKIFFDCHPAEARLAIETIEANRKRADGDEPELALIRHKAEVVGAWIDRITAVAESKKFIDNFDIATLNHSFAELEAEGRTVTHMLMDAYIYAYIRNWGRSIYDPEDNPHWVRAGLMGYLWTSDLLVRQDEKIFPTRGKSFILASLEAGRKDMATCIDIAEGTGSLLPSK